MRNALFERKPALAFRSVTSSQGIEAVVAEEWLRFEEGPD